MSNLYTDHRPTRMYCISFKFSLQADDAAKTVLFLNSYITGKYLTLLMSNSLPQNIIKNCKQTSKECGLLVANSGFRIYIWYT